MSQTRARSAMLPAGTLGVALVPLLALACRAGAQTPWVSDCSGVPTSVVGGLTWTPALCQEFNGPQGPPDTSAWAFDLDGGGWGNEELEIYCGPPSYPHNPLQCPASFSTQTANSYIDGRGHLVIQVIESGGSWFSARLKTQGIQNFQYGRIEASIKIPDTTIPGLWPAFWWLGSSYPMVPWPGCGESDILENWSPSILNGPGPIHNRSTIRTALTKGPGITNTYSLPSGQHADKAYYSYGVIWSANMIQFYVSPTNTPQPALTKRCGLPSLTAVAPGGSRRLGRLLNIPYPLSPAILGTRATS